MEHFLHNSIIIMKIPFLLYKKAGVSYVQTCSNNNAYLQNLNSKKRH